MLLPPGCGALFHEQLLLTALEGGGSVALGLALSGYKPEGFTHLPDGKTEVSPGRSQSGAKPRFTQRMELQGHRGWGLGWGLRKLGSMPVSDLVPEKSSSSLASALSGGPGRLRQGAAGITGTAVLSHVLPPPSPPLVTPHLPC